MNCSGVSGSPVNDGYCSGMYLPVTFISRYLLAATVLITFSVFDYQGICWWCWWLHGPDEFQFFQGSGESLFDDVQAVHKSRITANSSGDMALMRYFRPVLLRRAMALAVVALR